MWFRIRSVYATMAALDALTDSLLGMLKDHWTLEKHFTDALALYWISESRIACLDQPDRFVG
ncbi:MAG: hypothetical protein ABL921_10145 [Pirellula sp.]